MGRGAHHGGRRDRERGHVDGAEHVRDAKCASAGLAVRRDAGCGDCEMDVRGIRDALPRAALARPCATRSQAPRRFIARLTSIAFGAGFRRRAARGRQRALSTRQEPRLRSRHCSGPAVALALQFRLLDTFGRLLRFVFLARVPLIVLAAIAAFGPIGLGLAASLLGGILDVPGVRGASRRRPRRVSCWRSPAAPRSTWFAPTPGSACSTRRFGCCSFGRWRQLVFWTAVTATASLVFSMAVASADVSVRRRSFLGVAGGLAAGLLFLVRRRVDRGAVDGAEARTLDSAAGGAARSRAAAGFVAAARAGARRRRGAGRDQEVCRRASRSPEGCSVCRAAISAPIGGCCRGTALRPSSCCSARRSTDCSSTRSGAACRRRIRGCRLPRRSCSCFLLWSWALAGISFFLDRYRVPLFTSVIGLVLLSGSCKHTDHVVRLKPAPDHALASPGEILSAFPRHPLVVAAAGGGIQAGAWAARALQGIDEALGRSAPAAFRDRLALVTGVSGGSMGAMYYGAYRDLDVAKATEQSMAPSLDEVASALIGPDLLRAFWIPVSHGRGAALERSWASRLPGRFEPGDAWCVGGQGEALRRRHGGRRAVSRLPVRHDDRRNRAGHGICDVAVSDQGLSRRIRQSREAISAGRERQPRVRSVEGGRDTRRTGGRRGRDSRKAVGRVSRT